MSHGPWGLGGATVRPAGPCVAVVNVAPVTASASARADAKVFLFGTTSVYFVEPGLGTTVRVTCDGYCREWCTALCATIPFTSS